jgi:phosphoenolpyruvate carboxykinase (GTP)
VLAWIFRRCDGQGETVETPIGLVPKPEDLSAGGLDLSEEALRELLTVDEKKLRSEIEQVKEHLAKFGDDLPQEVSEQLSRLEQRLA